MPMPSSIEDGVRTLLRISKPLGQRILRSCGGCNAFSHRKSGSRVGGRAGLGASRNWISNWPASAFVVSRICSQPLLSVPLNMDPLEPLVPSVRWIGQLARGLSTSITSSARVTASSSRLLVDRMSISPPVKLPPRPDGASTTTLLIMRDGIVASRP